MTDLGDLRGTGGEPYVPALASRADHPRGWEPGVAYDGQGRTITGVYDRPTSPLWDDLVRHFGFDPAEVEVDGDTVECRTWQVARARRDGDGFEVQDLYYYRARLRRRQDVEDRAEVAALCDAILGYRPRKRPLGVEEGDRALVVCLADWQIGKGEGGGSEATVRRLLGMVDAVEDRLAELRLLGRRIDVLYVVGMGDLFEGCDGHYDMQAYSVDLDRREQAKVVRRVLLAAIERWSSLAPRLVVACVPGNHGENRKDGKAFTTFADNDDVAVFEQVADAFRLSGRHPGVSFVLPHDELAITLDIKGVVCAFAHGHAARGSGPSPQAKVLRWWEGQGFGMQPVGDARVLVTGHYHHLSQIDYGARMHLQCPAMDGGSKWHTDTSGQDAHRGTLTFTVGRDGVRDVEVVGRTAPVTFRERGAA